MAWIAQDPAAQRQIRDFELSTSEWRQVRRRAGNSLLAGDTSRKSAALGEQNATWVAKEIIGQVMPTYRELQFHIVDALTEGTVATETLRF